MIIRRSGKIVGRLDEETLELTGVRSKKLQRLVDDWRDEFIISDVIGAPGYWLDTEIQFLRNSTDSATIRRIMTLEQPAWNG